MVVGCVNSLKARVNRLAFESEYSEDTLMNTTERFPVYKPLEALDAWRKFAQRQ